VFSKLTTIKTFGPKTSSDWKKVQTDSRLIEKGQVFVALKGENFDGFNYIESVLEKGVSTIVCEQGTDREQKLSVWAQKYSANFFVVSDTVIALQELASAWRDRLAELGRPVIGVSGSNGKTTTKEMLAYLLKQAGLNPCATKKNNNNHIGVPLTLLEAGEEHGVVIVELGSNHPGEMKVICDIARPDAGIVTNIGDTHLEFFGDRQGVLKEEGELFYNISGRGKGPIIMPANDSLLAGLKGKHGALFVREGFTENANLFEPYNQLNLNMALTLSLALFPRLASDLLSAAKSFRMPKLNRGELLELGNQFIYLDAYNANPSSMQVAIEAFLSLCKKRGIADSQLALVVGDMNELGATTESGHAQIAGLIKAKKLPHVFYVGRYHQHYLKTHPEAAGFNSREEFKEKAWPAIRSDFRAVFLKASRSVELEKLLTEAERGA
jgi:UDP-N-acetylmuramoyl-tripeptide--D-alanyl-D-alanine ligase